MNLIVNILTPFLVSPLSMTRMKREMKYIAKLHNNATIMNGLH